MTAHLTQDGHPIETGMRVYLVNEFDRECRVNGIFDSHCLVNINNPKAGITTRRYDELWAIESNLLEYLDPDKNPTDLQMREVADG